MLKIFLIFAVLLTAPSYADSNYGHLASNFLIGGAAERQGDIEQAAEAYLSALALDPENHILLEKAFTYQLASGRVNTAVDLAKRIEKQGDPTAIVYVLLGLDHAKQGKHKEALEKIEKAMDATTSLLQFQLLKSYLDLANGAKTEEVLAELEDFRAHTVLEAYQQYHLGRIHLSKGDEEEAMKALIQAQQRDPGSLFTAVELGTLHERAGEKDMAREAYDTFLSANPESMLLHYELSRLERGEKPPAFNPTLENNLANVMFGFATLMVNQRLHRTAQQMIHMALYMEPEHPFARFYLGILEEQAERHHMAQAWYNTVSPYDPSWLAAQIRISHSLHMSGKSHEAKFLLQKLSKDYKNVPVIYQSLGDIAYESEKYERAIRYYDTLVGMVEDKPEAAHARWFFSRGAAHERLKQYEKASADLETALKLDPNNPSVLNYLGYMWVDLNKNIDKAFTYIGKALILKPNDGAITDSFGWAYYKKGNYEKALKFLERAVELSPSDPVINAHLGEVYEKLGRRNEARIQMQRAISLGLEGEHDYDRIVEKLEKLTK